MIPMRVKLLWIEGDGAEEFADLIGAAGELKSRPHDCGAVFTPDGRDDWLTIPGGPLAEDGDKFKARSAYTGMTYVFRKM